MEDGPEAAEGRYEYGGRTYRLAERESERWTVTADDGQYVGLLMAIRTGERSAPQYAVELPAGKGGPDEPATEDWRPALEYLIDQSVPPVGG